MGSMSRELLSGGPLQTTSYQQLWLVPWAAKGLRVQQKLRPKTNAGVFGRTWPGFLVSRVLTAPHSANLPPSPTLFPATYRQSSLPPFSKPGPPPSSTSAHPPSSGSSLTPSSKSALPSSSTSDSPCSSSHFPVPSPRVAPASSIVSAPSTSGEPTPSPSVASDPSHLSLAPGDMATDKGFASINPETLKTIGWTNDDDGRTTKEEEKEEEEEEEEEEKEGGTPEKFHGKMYTTHNADKTISKKLYALRGDVSAGYHQQLAASLQAFQPRPWHPLRLEDMEPVVVRCRPVSARPDRRPYTTSPGYVPAPPPRPRSQPIVHTARPGSSRRRPETPEVTPGNFDTLHPQILTDLMGRQESPLPSFGDRQMSEEDQEKDAVSKDDNSTTSGIDSIQSEMGSRSDSDWEEGDGEGEEPPLDRARPLPDLQLRPEALDKVYVPENRKDRRRFDFDASRVEIPPYEFPNPLPSILDEVDLKRCARMKQEWRELLPPGKDVSTAMSEDVTVIMSRLMELEKLQLDTEDWERGRQRAANARKPPTPGPPRIGSARPRDRRCCSSCLQAACVGDCPEKVVQFNVCNRCRQAFCTGTCSDTKYEQRMRQGEETAAKPPTPVKPLRSSCNSCLNRKSTAKLLNANSLVLGRPRSSLATFSRGQSCVKPPDLRPQAEEEVEVELSEELQRLGIDPLAPRPKTTKPWRQRGRNGVLPGKTYFSNRKDSITDIPEAVNKDKRKRTKTSKPRRPKTPSKS